MAGIRRYLAKRLQATRRGTEFLGEFLGRRRGGVAAVTVPARDRPFPSVDGIPEDLYERDLPVTDGDGGNARIPAADGEPPVPAGTAVSEPDVIVVDGGEPVPVDGVLPDTGDRGCLLTLEGFVFHSQFDLDSLGDGRDSWETALRLAAEKGGRVWVAEGGEVVAQLVLTEALAGDAATTAAFPAGTQGR